MKKRSVLVAVYLISLALLLTGWALMIVREQGEWLIGVGAMGVVVFLIMALAEVYQSRRITASEKLMWTVGFLLFNGITALVYLLAGRKHVVGIME